MSQPFQFLQKNRIQSNSIISDTITYLVQTYKQSAKVFTYATGFGQLLLVMSNHTQLMLYYVSDAVNELNFATANRNYSIYGMARLQGHSAMRGTSARGEISLRLKPGTQSLIQGNYVYIPNYTELKCVTNGLDYIIDLSADDVAVDITNPSLTKMRIIEGKLEAEIRRGTGESTQTYEIPSLPGKYIEDNFIVVTLNGERVPVYDSLYDIPFKKLGCLIKTGMTSGIDLIFGNKETLRVPQLGEEIRIDFLYTNGSLGNLDEKLGALFQFKGPGFDASGEEVDLNSIFDIHIEMYPNFGADAEDPALTKILAPNISRNFVIHDDRSLKYFLGKMNFFSIIKVFREVDENMNTYNVLLVPNINFRLSKGEDYFSADIDKFFLTETEEDRLVNMIDESGRRSSSVIIKPIRPTIRKFAMHLIIEAFENYNGNTVNKASISKDIKDALGVYMTTNTRINKVPHSDIIRIIDELDYIDTVKVIFIPEFEEDIDTRGNMSVGDKDMLVLRGGFFDSASVEYIDDFDPEGEALGCVNLEITYVNQGL